MARAASPASATISAAARPGSPLPPDATVAERAKSDRWVSPWPESLVAAGMATSTSRRSSR